MWCTGSLKLQKRWQSKSYMNDQNSIALDPRNSVVIDACAGSGKTWLLVSRIVRLLLAGVKPQEILAITFTRKAAQEMSARLNEWLEFLAVSTDDERRQFLRERSLGEQEIETLLPKAKRLFEENLAAQPGITINTFHGWFLQLLQKAPLTSGVAANFSLIEQTSLLIEDAWQEFARRLQQEEQFHAAFEFLLRKAGDLNTKKLLLNFIEKRAEWWAYTRDQRDPVAYALSKLEKELNVQTEGNFICTADRSFISELQQISLALRNGSQTLVKVADAIDASLAAEPERAFELLYGIFFTQKNELRTNIFNFVEKNPEKKPAYEKICTQLVATRQYLTNLAILEFNRAGLFCGTELLNIYQKIKTERQVMDFADVEWQAFRLINDSDYAAYMLHKLDSRYRHILIDEFQDTNPLQWQALLAWFNAYGPEENRPTVFLVGDPKQSIYRFRRADARLFDIAGEFLKNQYGAQYLKQNTTRRNSPQIVSIVNRLFTDEKKFSHFLPHISLNDNLAGGVEILPIVKTEQAAPEEITSALRNPLQEALAETEDLRRQGEARQFASRIQEIVKNCSVVDKQGKSRRARYGDIMVLTRSRTHLAEYEAALRAAHIPYLSTRQGGLLHALEVTDLVALLEFLITPFSDLRLAQALRSPIFSCTDDDLMMLARSGDGSWWQRLRRVANDQSASVDLLHAYHLLERWVKEVDTLPVHDLLDHIYHQSDLLSRYQAAVDSSLRASVKANLEAFMKLALTVDSGRYPSLPRFINELSNLRSASAQEAPDEGKVEADDSVNVVHLSTIHGAKGLESPIVWLLNANSNDAKARSYEVILKWIPGSSNPDHFSLYSVKEEYGAQREVYFVEEQRYAEREDLNLLYVALTRAKQWLFISGCENSKAEASWYAMINAVTEPSDTKIDAEYFADEPKQDKQDHASLETIISSPIGKRQQSLYTQQQQRGIWLHALLEQAASGVIKLNYASWQNKLSIDEFTNLQTEVEKILKAPHLQRFFNPALYLNAWNEFAYANQSGELRRIDRLVEFEDELWILDYKMGEMSSQSRRAAAYEKQLREYTLAVKSFFSAKTVHAALIFADAEFVEIR
jgi:ATP-dependent helicase/nuclease subunit A